MKKQIYVLLMGVFFTSQLFAQTKSSVTGAVKDNAGKALERITVLLLKSKDSSLVKTEISDATGKYEFANVNAGSYIINYSSVGYDKAYSAAFTAKDGETVSVPSVQLNEKVKSLQDVKVVSKKPLIEIKADRTVFNVENSINATGSNALELLQKSPGIMVDNNDNITMKGKTGTKIYIDGKMVQFDSKTLADFLKSINSSDIEAIEMISNPSAKYDASGNAGVINLRLKKNKKFGTNGTVQAGLVQGVTPKGNASLNLNYRDKKINLFGNVGGNIGDNQNGLNLYRLQKDTLYDQVGINIRKENSVNLKTGVDFFLNSRNTLGFLVTTNFSNNIWSSNSNAPITYIDPITNTSTYIKTLNAQNTLPGNRNNVDLNMNYRYADTSGREVNFDADYGSFRGRGNSTQPNNYSFAPGSVYNPYTIIYKNLTPIDIDIYTAKIDAEQKLWKGKLGYGVKFAYVKTKNTFNFYDVVNGGDKLNTSKSNNFLYKENVNAAYINYNRQINQNWSYQIGFRTEQTNSEGLLTRADGQVQADNDVKRDYIDLFPSAAITWNINQKHTLNLTYSRRIDRPTYQDLNPFENKLDELTYEKGNAFLRPQYTDNVELGHTFMGFLNTNIGYSYVKDYATQATDTTNNATYVQQNNLGTQQILSFNIGSPLPIKKWWNGYANVWYNYQMFRGHIHNNDLKVNVPLFGAFMQHTFTLGNNYNAELSGWFNGPSIWGATWRTKAQGGMDIGLSKQLFNKNATLKVAVTDIFHTAPWYATNDFGGVYIKGNGNWESQTVRVNFSYRFGSNQIKSNRNRQTGLESEAKRIK